MVDAIPASDDSSLFEEVERAVIAFARELTATAHVGDATFERARAHFEERQLVELVVNVGVANLNNRLTHAFWAEVEGGKRDPERGPG